MNQIRALAQFVGFCTLGLLALYGLLVLCGVAGPLGLAVEADAGVPNTPGEAAAVLGSTIPQTMNYQGFLRNPDGSLATGSYTITARIYELAAPSDGEQIFYTTTIPNVTVRDGLFNIVLGDDPALPPDAFSDVPRYIGIDLNDGGGELIPRQRLHAVPWAFTATTLVDDATVNGLSSSGDISVGGGISVTEGLSVGGGITVNGDLNVKGRLVVSPNIVLLKRFRNIGNDADISTGIPAEWWDCVATGWSARWDFNEYGSLPNVVWTYVNEDDYWWVRVEFASGGYAVDEPEDPDVDILCFRKEFVTWEFVNEATREMNEPD